MKTNFCKQAKHGVFLFLALLICAMAPVRAQTLIAPTSTQMNFGGPGINPTCFNIDDIPFPIAFGKADVYLSAVNNQVYWMAFHPVTGVFVIGGSIPYQGCVDINVGLRFSGVTPQLVVAYYKTTAPTGHRVDVYTWNAGGGSVTMVPGFPLTLSTLAAYTRITMDTHIETSGFSSFNAIVWEEASGIKITSCTGVTPFIGGLIPGTAGLKRPDVAFSHLTGGNLMLHFVYHAGTGPSYTILETSALYTAMHVALPASPGIQDTNPVTLIAGLLTASMDCPDHRASGPDQWTYVYSNNTASIFARISPTGLAGFTKDVLLTGSFVGLAMGMPVTLSEPRPRIAYNQSGASFHVAFYSNLVQGAVNNSYYSMQIDAAGTTLISTNDYERVATSVAPNGQRNSIALSRQNGSNKYLYCVFLGPPSTVHKFHPWATTASFRTTGIDNQSQVVSAAGEISVGPNPFNDNLRLHVPESLNDEMMTATLTDISGKLLLNYEGTAGEAPAAIARASKSLITGTYFLNTTLKTGDLHKNFKLQCVAGDH